MNRLRLLLVAMLAGSALAMTGCGKKSESSKPAEEHSEHDGHDHGSHEGHDH